MIYIIGEVHRPTPIKIGVTGDSHSALRNRLAAIQTGSHMKLVVLATMPGEPILESYYHRKFRKYRLEGEWFKREGEVAAFLEENFDKVVMRNPRQRPPSWRDGISLPAQPRPQPDARLFTVKEVRDILKVGPSTVYRLVADGHLKLVKLGRLSRVPAQSLDELLANIGAGAV